MRPPDLLSRFRLTHFLLFPLALLCVLGLFAAAPAAAQSTTLDTPGGAGFAVGANTVQMYWDPVSNANAYSLQYCETGDYSSPTTLQLGDVTRRWRGAHPIVFSRRSVFPNIMGLTDGTRYSFRIRARDTSGQHNDSLWSSWTEDIEPNVPPGAARNVKAAPGDGALTVTWQAPSSWGAWPAAGYVVSWKRSADNEVDYYPIRGTGNPLPATATSFTLSGTVWAHAYLHRDSFHTVANGTSYDIQVIPFAKRSDAPQGTTASRYFLFAEERPTATATPDTTDTGTTDTGTGGTGGGGGGGGGGTRTPADRHGDTPDAATSLNPRRYTTGVISRRMTAHLQSRRDIDYFTLDLPYAGILTASTTGADTTGRLYQAQDEGEPMLVTEDTDSGRGGAQLTPEQARLGIPPSGSFQSGIGVLSGWVCEAETVELAFEPATGEPFTEEAGYGTERGDTEGECGDTDNGFGLLYNWNRLGDGLHTVRAYADDEEFAHSTFTVTTLGEEFPEGLAQTHDIADFPAEGQTTTVEWQTGQQNFVITGVE